MFSQGQIVFSKCGRDRGNACIIFSVTEEYVYLVDGELRTVSKPKKKKIKHVQPTNEINFDLQHKLENNLLIMDADVRKALVAFMK